MDDKNQLNKYQLERYEQQCQELIELVERCIDFERWGFQRTFISAAAKNPPTIIYDSELCRLRIHHGGRNMYGEWDELAIYYGRLHAPSDKWVMSWNVEDCHCWHHQIHDMLDFLDGLSPQEAVNQLRVEHKSPHVIEEFNKSYGGGSQPERLIRLQVAVWEHYGQRFFSLFDLHEKDLWSQYANFVGGVHTIKGSLNYISPALNKIC